jgi:hypothetical protein
MADRTLENILVTELKRLEGIQGQHPETGAGLYSSNGINSYLDKYTNRIFGAPYQFIDTVDRRFSGVNTHIGNEYLRNIILNSPILHIKPGLPYYTGGSSESAIVKTLKQIYIGSGSNGKLSWVENLLMELASNTIFSKGSKLQKRMFGFRENYYQYMQHVNYMCRSAATFLNLTSSGNVWPNYAYMHEGNETNHFKTSSFASCDWRYYRFIDGTTVQNPTEEAVSIGKSSIIGKATSKISDIVSKLYAGDTASDDVFGLNESTDTTESETTNISDVITNKVSSVLFMVEPVLFEDTLTNTTRDSAIESAIDAVKSSIGTEIAFITGSNADTGLIGDLTEFLGSGIETAAQFISGLSEGLVGGFTTNLFNGALKSVKGQKMIYPKIYESSNSESNYTFTVNLNTPYGDPYHYYWNILVPLFHLIALTTPRMVTANTVNSPYLVQAFIPGMCTCQLGIISNMTIQKNPNVNRVSVNGFPLEVKVSFTVQELYNSLSISPANDPASFLFNETLNDYMSNLCGLQPCTNTYEQQRKNAFNNLETYLSSGEYIQDWTNSAIQKVEDFVNPYTGR